MMKEILLLGDPALYEVSRSVEPGEMGEIPAIIADLHAALMAYRARYGAGRAIAAPQIGVKKRIIYMHIGAPVAFINPTLEFPDDEMMTVLDDCMSFPGLYVNVRRYKRCVIRYTDLNGDARSMALEGGLSELLQHEYDHLDGILATMRAIDPKSFSMTGPAGKVP
jgi:peptide deformylase